MPTYKLTSFLDPLPTDSGPLSSVHDTAAPSCIIKTGKTEIIFFNGVAERIIQTIMKELKRDDA